MSGIKTCLFVLTALVYILVITADYCAPGLVTNITVTSNKLSWLGVQNLDCTITKYVVNVFDLEEGAELQYEVKEPPYSLSKLDMCKTYAIEVHALTDLKVLGPANKINVTIPPEENLNLSVNITGVTKDSTEDRITLFWEPINPKAGRCFSYYRVVHWDENNDPKDVYVNSKNFTLKGKIIPCMNYTFQVNAMLNNPDHAGALAETSVNYPAVPNPPKLVKIVTGTTTVNMTWKIPSYAEYRCELESLVLHDTDLSNQINTNLPIPDSPERSTVDVHLKNLVPYATYTSQVFLKTDQGESNNVTITFQASEGFTFNYENDFYY